MRPELASPSFLFRFNAASHPRHHYITGQCSHLDFPHSSMFMRSTSGSSAPKILSAIGIAWWRICCSSPYSFLASWERCNISTSASLYFPWRDYAPLPYRSNQKKKNAMTDLCFARHQISISLKTITSMSLKRPCKWDRTLGQFNTLARARNITKEINNYVMCDVQFIVVKRLKMVYYIPYAPSCSLLHPPISPCCPCLMV